MRKGLCQPRLRISLEAPSPTGAPLTIETTKEIGNRSAFSRNETKKETVLRQSGEVLDKERDSVGGALQAIKTGAEFPTGVTVIIQRKLSPRISNSRLAIFALKTRLF